MYFPLLRINFKALHVKLIYVFYHSQVPFGEVEVVKDWLKISGNVYKPRREHPQRPVLGMECKRSEVSLH